MDLSKIRIEGVMADKCSDLIKTLRDFPEKTIQGNFYLIEVSQNPLNGRILLEIFVYKSESGTIQFNAPKFSRSIEKSEKELEFNYRGQNYRLKESYAR